MKDKYKKNNSTKSISGRLEKKFAKNIGGKVTIGSGCLYFDTSDIKFKDYLIEHKYTQKSTYFVSDKVIKKNEQEAYSQLKRPLIVIQFIDDSEKLLKTYVILRDNTEKIEKVNTRIKLEVNADDAEYPQFVNINNIIYKVISVEEVNEELFDLL